MSEAQAAFAVLRQSADPAASDAVEQLVRDAPDHELNRINALDFAAKAGIDPEHAIAGLLHAARLGLFPGTCCAPVSAAFWTQVPL